MYRLATMHSVSDHGQTDNDCLVNGNKLWQLIVPGN